MASSRISATIEPRTIPVGAVDERLKALARLAAARRTHTLPDNPADDDLADPIGQPIEEFVRCADAIDVLITRVMDVLTTD